MPEIVVGRDDEDMKKYGTQGTLFIGRHLVGMGEDTHMTTPVLLDALRPHIILLTGKRGEGKCLDGDTLITMGSGDCVPIKELQNDKNNIFALSEELKICPALKEGFYKRNVDRMLRLKLRSGKKIKLTPEHSLLTINGWKPAQELTVGSRIATPRKIEAFGNEQLPIAHVKLLAYLIAEGHIRQHRKIRLARFTNTDREIIGEFRKCVAEFDSNLAISQYGRYTYGIIDKRMPDTRITKRDEKGHIVSSAKFSVGNSVISWLQDIGAYGELSKNKAISNIVFRLPKEQLKVFLNRLFSCDGSIYDIGNSYEISYSSASNKLARQVHSLLLKFGIVSKLKERKVKYRGKEFQSYEIIIRGEFVNIFLGEIGFFGQKDERAKKALLQQKNRNTNIDTIPREVWENFVTSNWAKIGRAFKYTYPKAMRESIRYAPSREKLLQIARVESHRGLELLAESDIFWDEIVAIELLEGNFEVFDISVPDFHNFIANDIIVHNSYSMGIIVEELTKLPHNIRKNICSVIIDTQGIFWTMKSPSERDALLLKGWDIAPAGFECEVYVPEGQVKIFSESGVDFDSSFSVSPSELTTEDWFSVFSLRETDPLGILLHITLSGMKGDYKLDDIISKIDEQEFDNNDKLALKNHFVAAKDWGIFGESKMPEMLTPGKVTIIDVSLTPQNVRALLVGMASRRILEGRVKARRSEEMSDIELSSFHKVPMPWLFIDEAHNFLPNEGTTAATEVLSRIVKEGRQPGITLVFATQRPEKLHADAVAQADIIISHRLTAKADIDTLKAIMQTYLIFDIGKYIGELPHLKGVAIILDDNSERLYKVRMRPRQSWHAGSSPVAI